MSLPDNWLPRDMAGLMLHGQGTRPLPCTCSPTAQHAPRVSRKGSVAARAAAAAPAADQNLGFKTMRRGIKEASAESVLTPRFYTTDFEQMEEMFSLDKNPGMLRPGTPAATTSQLHWLHGHHQGALSSALIWDGQACSLIRVHSVTLHRLAACRLLCNAAHLALVFYVY